MAVDSRRIGLGSVALSLVFAGIGAFAARDAARAGTEAARIARNAERPYIVPTDPIIREFNKLNTGEPWDSTFVGQYPAAFGVHFGLHNVGRGLAVILGYGINHELCAVTEHGGKELLTREGFGGFVLSPGSPWKSEAGFHQFQMTEDEFREIATTETKTLYVYGYIRYADLFGIVRRTGFSYEAYLNSAGDFGPLVIETTNRGALVRPRRARQSADLKTVSASFSAQIDMHRSEKRLVQLISKAGNFAHGRGSCAAVKDCIRFIEVTFCSSKDYIKATKRAQDYPTFKGVI